MNPVPYEHEFAPRLGHVPAASNAAIEQALTRWTIPAIAANDVAIERRIIPVDELAVEPGRSATKFAFAFDGSDIEVPARTEYPSVTVGFLQIGGALVNLEEFFRAGDRGLVDPRKLRQAMDARSIQSVLPGSMITRPGLTGVDTWRLELHDMFRSSGFTEADQTYSLRDALLALHGGPGEPAPSVQLGRCAGCTTQGVEVPTEGRSCPSCSIPLYITDVLRTHDEFAESSASNMVPFTRVMNTAERLLSLGYVDWLYSNYPSALATTIFIQDGPLAFFGTTAPLMRRWLRYWERLNTKLAARGNLSPLVVGVEKSGVFVEHANAISDRIPNGSIMVLDNRYIQTHVRAKSTDRWYGQDEFYGRRFFYKTSTGRILVLTVPRTPSGTPYNEGKQAPTATDGHANPSMYVSLRSVVEVLDAVQTRMYANAVIPVALAHEAVALPLGTGSHVLTLMAKQALGIS